MNVRTEVMARAAGLAMLGSGVCAQPCAQWVQVTPPPGPPQPVARWGHRMSYDSARHRVVMTTGYDNANFLSDTWEYDCATRLWQQVSSGPPPTSRAEGAMAYDDVRAATWLYSGANTMPASGHHQMGLLRWDGANWALFTPPGPSARHGHSMAFDSARGALVLYGSKHGEDDTWEFDTDAMTWALRSTDAPGSPRSFLAMDYDASRGRTVAFGGYDATNKGGPLIALNQTLEWDGTAWALMSPAASPGPRFAVGGVYDALRRRFVIVAGSTGGPLLGDTWSYDGTTWVNLNAAGLPVREHPGVAFDSRRGRLVLFGGHNLTQGAMGDTWELTFDPRFTQQPESATVSEGEPVALSVEAMTNGAAPLEYQWRKDEQPIAGAVFPTLMIGSAAPEDAGEYVCVVTGGCGAIYSLGATLIVLGPCPGDANGDRVIDFADLNLVLGNFGGAGAGVPGDVNHDGVVDFTDLNLVLSFFGIAC